MAKNDSPRVEQSIWTDADFERMGWHDAALHAVAVEPAAEYPGRLLLDLDYIVGAVVPEPPAVRYGFWMCPATLVFDLAADLVVDLDLTGRAFTPAFDAIERSEPDRFGNRSWSVAGHEFTIELRAAGFTQYLRREPLLADDSQRLTVTQRGGPSFEERGFEERGSGG